MIHAVNKQTHYNPECCPTSLHYAYEYLNASLK